MFGKRNQVGGMSSFGLELLQGSKKIDISEGKPKGQRSYPTTGNVNRQPHKVNPQFGW